MQMSIVVITSPFKNRSLLLSAFFIGNPLVGSVPKLSRVGSLKFLDFINKFKRSARDGTITDCAQNGNKKFPKLMGF